MTISQTFEQIAKAVAGTTTVIHAHASQKRPPEPYFLLTVTSTVTVGHESHSGQDEQDQRTIHSVAESMLQLDYYGDNAIDVLHRVAMLLRSEQVKALTDELDCAIVGQYSALRMPEMINQNQWRERAILEFKLRHHITATETLSTIERVELPIDLYEPGSAVPYRQTAIAERA